MSEIQRLVLYFVIFGVTSQLLQKYPHVNARGVGSERGRYTRHIAFDAPDKSTIIKPSILPRT